MVSLPFFKMKKVYSNGIVYYKTLLEKHNRCVVTHGPEGCDEDKLLESHLENVKNYDLIQSETEKLMSHVLKVGSEDEKKIALNWLNNN